ncbi:MAG: hypothetical protein IH624_20295 [Phycisphaerae bacterium]|nr:hypothetical protein [Phycisphaerae bacterium]
MNTRISAAILMLTIICAQSSAATFQGAGTLGGVSLFRSECWGVSGDGSIAYGSSPATGGGFAFRWNASTGIQSLGDLPGGHTKSYALNASYDGSVIVGTSYTTDSGGHQVHRAYTWTKATGMKELPLPEDPFYTDFATCAFAISADGRTAVGLAGRTDSLFWDYSRLLIWDLQASTPPSAHRLPYEPFTYAQFADASASAAVILIVGATDLLWTNESGFHETVPGAMALSGDGSTILGARPFFGEPRYDDSFVWTQETGCRFIGTIDGFVSNHASAISHDGSIVVGTLFNDIMQHQDHAAYLWTEHDGVRLIQDILENDCGLDLDGWILTNASGISYDGRTIVGNGINPEGYEEGWIATLPACSLRADLTGDCTVDIYDLLEFANQWLATSQDTPCPLTADLAGQDCNVNLKDFATLATEWLQQQ